MTLKNYVKYGFIVLAILFGAYVMGIQSLIVKAAMLVFAPTSCYTNAATSTLSYMTYGTATTTVTCPMGNDGADSAVLAIQVNASSTNTVFNVYAEESMDGQDWYPVGVNQVSTTSVAYDLTTRAFSSFTFASSSIKGAASGVGLLGASTTYEGYRAVNNRNNYELNIPVRMKQVRAYAVIATTTTQVIGTGNGAVWMQIIPKVSI